MNMAPGLPSLGAGAGFVAGLLTLGLAGAAAVGMAGPYVAFLAGNVNLCIEFIHQCCIFVQLFGLAAGYA
jgi:hypothetical protein